MHQVFISYANENQDIVENLADRLGEYGVASWVYSLNKTLAYDTWKEIEEKIDACEVFLFIVSKFSEDAEGQCRESELVHAIDKIESKKPSMLFFPILLDSIGFSSIPEKLKHINGITMDAYTVKSTALDITRRFFPDLKVAQDKKDWKYPIPGQWLRVCNLDIWIEEHFDIGAEVYFRRISPLGLFECYAPNLNGLFWFAPENLQPTDIVDEGGDVERAKVPRSYQYSTSYDCERIGIEDMRKRGVFD